MRNPCPGQVWVITVDYLFDPAFDSKSRVGVFGPHYATNDERDRCLEEGEIFELYDDDGELVYSGKFLGDPLAPLYDFGMPDAGCTTVKVNGEVV